jgi:hypothetical protein
MAERAAMFPAVSPRTVRDSWLKQFQGHADRILGELASHGRADLCKAFALPLSAECLSCRATPRVHASRKSETPV